MFKIKPMPVKERGITMFDTGRSIMQVSPLGSITIDGVECNWFTTILWKGDIPVDNEFLLARVNPVDDGRYNYAKFSLDLTFDQLKEEASGVDFLQGMRKGLNAGQKRV